MSHPHIQGYRPDIDGLRAFAVLAVVTFHAFPATVRGGFLGVDVFFAISGYLICGILLRELEAGSFSFLQFYSRRVRRIFPALLLVLAALLPLGWHMLLPDEYAALGKHILGGATFSSNLLLWSEAGYFDAAAKAKPLLHLWSLGIEEQFYIFFPLLLWACAKRHFRLITIILFLTLLSFLDNIYLHTIDRTADFYSPLARVWELLAGAGLCAALRQESTQRVLLRADKLCASLLYSPARPNDGRSLSLALAVTGFCLLGVGLLLARQTTPWPGYEAVLPILGALCLMAAGPHNAVSATVLCNRVSVFVGRISYPLYLWHWPLLSLAFIQRGGLTADTRLLRVGLVLLSFALAVATYLLVEKPIRFGQSARRAKVWGLVAGMALMAGAGGTIYGLAGLPERAKFREIAAALQQLERPPRQDAAGLAYTGIRTEQLLYCRYTDARARETVAIVGDSHASSAYVGVARLGTRESFNSVLLGWWIPGGAIWRPDDFRKYSGVIFNILQRKKEIRKVFLVTRGMIYITSVDNAGDRAGVPRQEPPVGEDNYKKSLQEFIDMLRAVGKEVFVVAENPELLADPRDYINRNTTVAQLKNNFLHVPKSDVLSRQQAYLDILANIKDATVIPTIDAFCPTEQCTVFSADGLPLYYDDDHLSVAGSIFQAEQILRPYLLRPRQP